MNANQTKIMNKTPLCRFLFLLIVLQFITLTATILYVNSIVEAPNFITFIGRFHPLLLHFPIGIISLMFFLRFAQFITGFNSYHSVYNVIWLIATPSTTLTALFGILLSANGDYNAELLYLHKLFGSALAFSLLIASYFRLRYWHSNNTTPSKYHRVFFIITIVLLPLTGHDGGSLTHGSKYLFEHLPESLDFFNLKENTPQPIHSDELNTKVLTLFKKKCYNCHGIEKQKGNYRLDLRELALKGGESEEKAIVPGNALQSHLFDLISRYTGDEEIMPPNGKGSLSAENILNIKHWIDAGAHWPSGNTLTTPSQSNAESTQTIRIDSNKPKSIALDFETHIWPIIKNHCLKCHSAPYVDKKGKNKKPKAGLHLDTAKMIMKGSKEGLVIIKGKPNESSFYTLTTLNEDDDDIMPSKGDPLTKEQQKIIHDWILDGAHFNGWESAE